ncbi:hypothetical protein RJ639_007171 [Escallonia herrerae]|uniref:Uncharacterized protein n=1 Tax=Escallonia herrerae TaxID=1293975 RepID=A0AA89ASV1_9ASTE|nr:hypothetical protein RJ639_007171 [Escallonia herrerae]
MDFDYALRVDVPTALMAESSIEQKTTYEKWERSNCISLMIMKGFITITIRGAIPDSDNAKMHLAHIEKQFQGSSKAHATTFITKMVTLKYSGSSGDRKHILRMNDMASQLKGMDMEIFEDFLMYFIMTSLPAQFGPFKINYNTQKENWKMSELIYMCVQEEERLKSEQPDGAYVAITGTSKGKRKKFGKGMQRNKSASITKTDKVTLKGLRISDFTFHHTIRIVETRHAVFFEDVEYSGSCTPRIINLGKIQDHVSIPVIQKVLGSSAYLQGAHSLHISSRESHVCSSYVFMLAEVPISWKSGKQSLVDSHTIKAEFVTCFEASCHGVWLRNFIT